MKATTRANWRRREKSLTAIKARHTPRTADRAANDADRGRRFVVALHRGTLHMALGGSVSLLLFLAGVAESIAAGHFLSALMASLLAVVVAGVLYGLARGGMGQGDIWYYAALATWLSPLQTLLLLWLAALLGACFGISSRGFSSRCQAIPFGPFLTLAVGLATPVGSWLGYG